MWDMASFMSSVDQQVLEDIVFPGMQFIIILAPNLELQHWTLFTFQPITILL